jgi:hypothetical protein
MLRHLDRSNLSGTSSGTDNFCLSLLTLFFDVDLVLEDRSGTRNANSFLTFVHRRGPVLAPAIVHNLLSFLERPKSLCANTIRIGLCLQSLP